MGKLAELQQRHMDETWSCLLVVQLKDAIRKHHRWIRMHSCTTNSDLDLFVSKVESLVSSFLLFDRSVRTTMSQINKEMQEFNTSLLSNERGGLFSLVCTERSVAAKRDKALQNLQEVEEPLKEYFREIQDLLVNVRDSLREQVQSLTNLQKLEVCNAMLKQLNLLGESVFRKLDEYPKEFASVMKNIEEMKVHLLYNDIPCRSERSRSIVEVVQHYEKQRAGSFYDEE